MIDYGINRERERGRENRDRESCSCINNPCCVGAARLQLAHPAFPAINNRQLKLSIVSYSQLYLAIV